MKKRIVLLVAAFLLSGDGLFNSTVFNSGLSNNGLSNGSLLLGGSAAWAQNDLGISKGKINKSLKRLEQLVLIIRQVDESGVIGISAGMTGSTESTSSSNDNTTISSNGAALLMEVAGRCKELSGEILQNMGRVSTLGTLHSSSQKLLQRTLLLSKVDEIAKSLALHKSNLEALKSEAQADKAAQARIAKLVAKAIGIMEQEYEFQVLATGCMASALGAMD